MQVLHHSYRTFTNDLCQRMIRETESYLNRRLPTQSRPLSATKPRGAGRPASRA